MNDIDRFEQLCRHYVTHCKKYRTKTKKAHDIYKSVDDIEKGVDLTVPPFINAGEYIHKGYPLDVVLAFMVDPEVIGYRFFGYGIASLIYDSESHLYLKAHVADNNGNLCGIMRVVRETRLHRIPGQHVFTKQLNAFRPSGEELVCVVSYTKES